MGSSPVTIPVDSKRKGKPCEDGVPSGDVPIAILANKITAETDDTKKAMLEQQLLEELQVAKNLVAYIIVMLYLILFSSVQMFDQQCARLQLKWPSQMNT